VVGHIYGTSARSHDHGSGQYLVHAADHEAQPIGYFDFEFAAKTGNSRNRWFVSPLTVATATESVSDVARSSRQPGGDIRLTAGVRR
jgi:hypothetical protein